jgi:hypothetical protein
VSQIQITDSWGGVSFLADDPETVQAHALLMYGPGYRASILDWYKSGVEEPLRLPHAEVADLVEFWERVS